MPLSVRGCTRRVIAFLAEGQPQEFPGVSPQAEEQKSGDKKSVDKEVTDPSKQVKRTVMHCVQINAKISRQS